jgi:hypothetical protein
MAHQAGGDKIGKRGFRSQSTGAALAFFCSSRLTTDPMLPVMALPKRKALRMLLLD